MAYRQTLNGCSSISKFDAASLSREFDSLRAELNDIRTKFAATLTKLDSDAGVTDTNYGSLGALATAQFTAT